jgi:hypothetical protein
VAYQQQIQKILSAYKDTIVEMRAWLGKRPKMVKDKKTGLISREWLPSEKTKYGFEELPDQVKVHTSAGGKQYIYVVVDPTSISKQDRDCETHAEILAGILFEAANVYVGLSDLPTEKQEAAEAPVTVNNAHRSALRAASGYSITQQEWRNLVPVFLSDINLSKFKVTDTYLKYYLDRGHAIVGDYGTGQH